jgi:DNA invertase Pin-like site-specific DNA recombinase
MKAAALYLRVSTQNQHNGLEAQQRALLSYCEQNAITDYRIYSDEGISGGKSSRPELSKLMADIDAGLISTVVVYSFSRFARSTKHLIEALEHFNTRSVGFVSLSERLETNTPSGRAIFTILAAISQLERELVSERVKNGLVNAVAKGKPPKLP